MSNTAFEVCKKCGGHIRHGAGRSEFLEHVPMTKWYHINCPTGSRWESPWLTGPNSDEDKRLTTSEDPTLGYTESEWFGGELS